MRVVCVPIVFHSQIQGHLLKIIPHNIELKSDIGDSHQPFEGIGLDRTSVIKRESFLVLCERARKTDK